MDMTKIWESLIKKNNSKIIYVVLDGAGGLPYVDDNKSALESAYIPNLDTLAAKSSCGLLETVGPGITPGSGPGHLALFGYDPLHHLPGRGVLSALGIDFPLQKGDVAAFNETACLQGALGIRPGLDLMGLALANAGRLRKYGA